MFNTILKMLLFFITYMTSEEMKLTIEGGVDTMSNEDAYPFKRYAKCVVNALDEITKTMALAGNKFACDCISDTIFEMYPFLGDEDEIEEDRRLVEIEKIIYQLLRDEANRR